ncbi:MAG TPA: hypothetical protein VEA78_00435, partial [Acidimicrobiales bacterium]|nr:hypothetical protein [Acidimicrobiales bacterium]
TVFLCGGAGHERDFWELLDLVVCLVADDDTLRRRLAARTDNGYGKTAEELAGILDANASWAKSYRDSGAVIVDSTKPLDEVVDTVLAAAEERLRR